MRHGEYLGSFRIRPIDKNHRCEVIDKCETTELLWLKLATRITANDPADHHQNTRVLSPFCELT
jgi:hypothetical protein